MQYYRETVSHPDFSSEIKPITPERTEPELESNNKPGVNHLCDVLKDSHCKLETLTSVTFTYKNT